MRIANVVVDPGEGDPVEAISDEAINMSSGPGISAARPGRLLTQRQKQSRSLFSDSTGMAFLMKVLSG
ncbi:hypothetical protein AO729_07350 [Pseudomonas sp. TTU2014-066ASC]|uniref:hypothetical protein n=1 Tax=Stutzerimonas nitrititolerans TaxID=2482751 RepID=UPI00071855D7|nr:hypothetical protein [Stutzerimonas nitrititolerans]KRW64812.1 hypothetical protein AO729_07350 [Pseudomonas sp. TTU2014-066ASC]